MPTQEKVQAVETIKGWLDGCTIAISTDPTGITLGTMTALRRALRENGVGFHVVKNTLAHRAADAAGKPWLKQIIDGPTAVAFGYGDPTVPARTLTEFIRRTRSSLTLKGGVLGERRLSAEEVAALAELPSKEVMVARLLGQLNAPLYRLVRALNAPIAGLATVLQRRVEAMQVELPPRNSGTGQSNPDGSGLSGA